MKKPSLEKYPPLFPDVPSAYQSAMIAYLADGMMVVNYNHVGKHYIVFLNSDDFLTYDINHDKWRTSMIDRFGPAIWLVDREIAFVDEESLKAIQKFTGFEEMNPTLMIFNYQRKIREKQLEERHQKEKKEIDEVMELVPGLPEDFGMWIDQEVFKDKRFSYYDYSPTKTVAALCDYCGVSFTTKRPKHGQEGKCPECNSGVTFLAKGRTSHFSSFANALLLQNTKLGLLLRIFRVKRYHEVMHRSRTENPLEIHRVFIEANPVQSFSYESFKNMYETRWCNSTDSSADEAYFTEGFLYSKNLREVLDNAPYKYSGIDYMAKISQLTPTQYFGLFNKNQLVELLAKAGLSNLINQVDIQKTDKKLSDITGITDSYYLDMVMKSNPTASMIYCMEMLQRDSRKHTIEDVRMYAGQPIPFLEEQLKKKEHPRKIYKYLTNQKITTKNRWHAPESASAYFVDYTRMRDELGDLLANDEGKYPKHLKAAHDRITIVYNDHRKELDRRFDEEVEKLVEKAAKKHGKKINFEDSSFKVVVAGSVSQLKDEGEALHHCVGSYSKKMAKGNCLIAFVRKIDDPEIPLTTIEINPKQRRIVQARAKYNKTPERPILDFLQAFARAKKLEWSMV